MFSKIFIDRPKFAMVISIVMILAGVICMKQIPVAEYPEIAPPTIMVIASYPGASSEEIADTIASPIEQEVNGLENMMYFSSESTNDGSYALTITFNPGTDDDIALVNVQNAIRRAEPKLPVETTTMGIRIMKRSGDMLGVYVFRVDSAKSGMDIVELGNYIRTNIRDEIARIDGISQAEIMGASDYAMRIWLDPMKMSALNITPSEVSNAIRQQNVQAAAGAVGGENSSDFIQLKVNALGRLKTPGEFENITVRVSSDGRMVKLKDIARVELGSEDYTWEALSTATMGGDNKSPMEKDMTNVVCMAIYRNSDANAINVVDAANKKLRQLEKFFPEGVGWTMAYDPTDYIRTSMEEIIETLIVTLILVVAITYLFLQNWRATLIPTLTIPVSIFATFAVMYPLGYTMNLLTMFALILVIGSLVDDAIVVTENVIRLMDEEGLSPYDASVKSMEQITGAVIATTLVIIAIYAPIGFYGGMVGTIYMQFSVTMCVALIFSTINALTLSPALCSLLLRPTRQNKVSKVVFAPFNFVLYGSRTIYLKCTGFLVRFWYITAILFAGVLYLNYHYFMNINNSFLPEEDKGALLVAIELPPGATLTRTRAASTEFYEKVKDIPGVKDLMVINGFSFIGGKGENLALAIVALKDWEYRTTPETQISAIKTEVQKRTAGISSARIMVMQPPAIMGLGNSNDVSFMLQGREGQTPEQLEMAVRMLMMKLNNKEIAPEVAMAYSQFNASTPQLYLDIDREKAETMGIPVSRIFSTLQSKLASVYVNDFNLHGFSFKVKVQSDLTDRKTISDIEHINIQNNQGGMVPLSSIATLRYQVGPRVVTRFTQNISASFMVGGLPGTSTSQVMRRIQEVVDKDFKGYAVEWTDLSYQEQGNEGKLVILMSLALIFAYLFLVAQYESWTMPLSVIFSVALATLGALIGLHLCGMTLSIYAQLGLIMLIGLAGKNAILMAEFSKQAREEGQSIYDAAQNGGKVRYRAVLMTAYSFVIGVLPMVWATGAGAGSRRAIGITTFAGMVLASVIGIVFVPPLYALFQRMRELVNPMKPKKQQ